MPIKRAKKHSTRTHHKHTSHHTHKTKGWFARYRIAVISVLGLLVVVFGGLSYAHQAGVLGTSTIAMLYTGDNNDTSGNQTANCHTTTSSYCVKNDTKYYTKSINSCTDRQNITYTYRDGKCGYYSIRSPKSMQVQVVSATTGSVLPGLAVTIADNNGYIILNGTNGPKKYTTGSNGVLTFNYTQRGPLTMWVETQDTSANPRAGAGHIVSQKITAIVDGLKSQFPGYKAAVNSVLMDCGSSQLGEKPCKLQVQDSGDYSIYPKAGRSIVLTKLTKSCKATKIVNYYAEWKTNYLPSNLNNFDLFLYNGFSVFSVNSGGNSDITVPLSIRYIPGTFYHFSGYLNNYNDATNNIFNQGEIEDKTSTDISQTDSHHRSIHSGTYIMKQLDCE